ISTSSGYPSTSASRRPLSRSINQSFCVVVLNPNRASSLNWCHQSKGKPETESDSPTANKKPAEAQTELPIHCAHERALQGRNPEKRTSSSIKALHEVSIWSKRPFATV